jgi:MFS family permease
MEKKTLYTLFFVVFCSMTGVGIIAPFLPLYARQLGANGFWIGMVFTSFILASAVVMPIVGRLSDKAEKKVFISIGLSLYIIASLFYPLVRNLTELICVRLLHGVAAGILLPVVMASCGEGAKKGEEGRTMSTLNMTMYLGIAAGPFLGGILNDTLGMKDAFYFLGIVCAVALIATQLFLPDTKIKTKDEVTGYMSFKNLIKYNIVKALLIVVGITAMRTTVFIVFVPLMVEKIHLQVFQTGLIIATGTFCAGILQPYFGKLADRESGPTRFKHALRWVLIGSIVSSVGLVLLPASKNLFSLLLCSALLGMGTAVTLPPIMTLVVRIGKKAGMGSWMGIFNSAKSVAMIISPLIAGIMLDFINVQSVFYSFSFFSVAGTIICCYYIARRIKGYKTG